MLDRVQPPGRRRSAAALVAAVALLGAATSAHATAKDCRDTIGKQVKSLFALGASELNTCHKNKDKVCTANSDRAACNVLESTAVDAKGKYAAKEAKVLAKIAPDCTGFEGPYPGGVQAAVLDKIVSELNGNTSVSLGDDDLLCDKAVVTCHKTIATERTKVLKEVLIDSIKCQAKLDKTASSFGVIDPSCVDGADKSGPKAKDKIAAKCAAVADLSKVGSCSNDLTGLSNCVVDSAIATGQDLAKALYGQPATGCGNGTVEGSEQCDDANALSGDGCSSSCELEGNSCTPWSGPGAGTGTRLVKVAITTPQPLGGLQVTLDYPQFEAGIPGVGTSSIVQSRFTALQPAALATMNDDNDATAVVGMINIADTFDSGDLFQVTLDNCVALSQNICNRNQQVFGCGGRCHLPNGTGGGQNVCFGDADCASGEICDNGDPLLCNPGTNLPFGPGPQAGCCGGDNACYTQVEATGCSVSDPVDEFGQPVAGVTCSVTVTEQP
jgi:cysteine-rich repeat protein